MKAHTDYWCHVFEGGITSTCSACSVALSNVASGNSHEHMFAVGSTRS
jgi:hypothetical protein